MTCYNTIKGWYSKNRTPNGKREIVFTINDALTDRPVDIPCGQCIGCRIDRSRQWAIRCYHEASLYEDNCFVTLTIDQEHMPENQSVDIKHLQDFMKALRHKYYPNKIRFYACGEYGDTTNRAHYHLLLFNHDFPDKTKWGKTKQGHIRWRSAELEGLWDLGHSEIGTVTFQSAGYVARYILKKQKDAPHLFFVDKDGKTRQRNPEFTTMSRMPGIGKPWLDKFKTDVFPGDFVVIDGKKFRTPRYYDTAYETSNPVDHKKLKWTRKAKALKHKDNQTPERLRVREQIQRKKAERLPRNHDLEGT